MIVVVAATKADLRARIRARRAALPAGDSPAKARRLLTAARAGALLEHDGRGRPAPVAGYIASPGEPDVAAIALFVQQSGGQVLLPIPRRDRVLDWALDDGRYERDPRLPVSTPVGPVVGSAASGLVRHGVRLVLVPALAVDRAGTRLGQGGGYYDRLLARLDPGIRAVAVVDDEELLAAGAVPRQDHDQPVGWALTPSGLVELKQ